MFDESQLPEGWDQGLVVERGPDGAIRRVSSEEAVLEIDAERLVVREHREIRWDSLRQPDGSPDPSLGAAMALTALQGVIARARGIGCSFCASPAAVVRKLFSGPNVYICDECVLMCARILAEEDEGG